MLVLLPLALLTPTATGAGRQEPVVPAARAAECPFTFIGLHGLNEDSSSPTIQTVWTQFNSLAEKRGLQSRAVFLNHPKLTFSEFFSQIVDQQNRDPISRATGDLKDAATNAANRCHPARLVLVGYSEGAWIIDQWIQNADSTQLSQIAAVLVLGDPQWDNGDHGQGLARRANLGINPYIPSKPLGDRFTSLCLPRDPVCGEGYGNDVVGQFRDARNLQTACGIHCSYTKNAIQSVVQTLVTNASTK
ncbi:cutinase family protein [Saccharopolyspora sp. WRP15-2]|uniref:Cutinase family protein n=1 Tax=Saccharopolyspora oryzae TaxID=2997343 RepID=A0ABT4V099_9PSEU|nr:cutinase family protein [Saccharopolyspora oryzae]MDA3627365.1 cutinase family protein [Saccharopolyspora oryzae]